MNTKICAFCKKELSKSMFGGDKNKKGKLSSYCKECAKLYTRRLRIKYRYEALKHYCGGEPICGCCGEKNIEFLTLDHINGGGKKHMQEIGYNIVRWLRKNKYPSGFRVLCMNCNFAIGHYGYCPHKDESEIQEQRILSYKYSIERVKGGRLTKPLVAIIKRRILNGDYYKDIMIDYGIKDSEFYNIKLGKTWKAVEPIDVVG